MDMNRINLVTLALASTLGAFPVALVTPADAQVDIQIGTAPPPPPAVPRYGPYGDRERDGIPNRYDRHDDNRRAWGDRDHDGIPNRYDRYDNRAVRDRDGDGVPDRYDRAPNNPNWR
jgi:hypothetical protein